MARRVLRPQPRVGVRVRLQGWVVAEVACRVLRLREVEGAQPSTHQRRQRRVEWAGEEEQV